MALSNSKTTKAKRKQVSANVVWHKQKRSELAEMKADYKAFLTKHPEFKPAKKASKTVKTTGKVICENDKFKSCTATIYSNPANPDRQKIVLTSYKKTGRGGVNAAIKRNVKKVETRKTKVAKDKKEEARLEKVVAKSQADARKKVTTGLSNAEIEKIPGYYGSYYILNGKRVDYTKEQQRLIEKYYAVSLRMALIPYEDRNSKKFWDLANEVNRMDYNLKETGLALCIIEPNKKVKAKSLVHSLANEALVWVYKADKSAMLKQRNHGW